MPAAVNPKLARALAFHREATEQAQQGRFDAAAESLSRAIALVPQLVQSRLLRGAMLCELRRYDEAIADFEFLARAKNDANSHNNLGVALAKAGRLDAALASFDRAMQLDPTWAEPLNKRGLALREANRIDEAIACYDRAIASRPDDVDAHWYKAAALLLAGRYDEGWPLYEWRWKRPEMRNAQRTFSKPMWTGTEPLEGKTVLVHCEQGFGDSLQFVRFVKDVAARGARVTLSTQPHLVQLFRDAGLGDRVIAFGEPLGAFDFHCPLMSLPLVLRITVSAIPHADGYLRADPAKVDAWSQRLGVRRGPRIGIAWNASTRGKRDDTRSVPLPALVGVVPGGCEIVSLQKDLAPGDAGALRELREVRHFGEHIADFTDTAALASLMDAVVSVDTSVVHVAAAMGRPTHVLVPFSPDWRWLLGRDDSPWYRSARLHRQAAPREWGAALDSVREGLGSVREGLGAAV